jgi:hypothetical protein
MNAGEMFARGTALLAGVLFVTLAVVLWIGPGALGTYPVALRVVFGLFLVAYGVWRARQAWLRATAGREN